MLPKDLIIDTITAPMGEVPVVSTTLRLKDLLGTLKVRLNIGRMKYTVAPGLYAIGQPDTQSPVFVSANYKMSFDALRRELCSVDAWILVLDTQGINVWCAAGKGTFGTEELVKRIREVALDKVVKHRRLIVPQLGATGVAAHIVKEATGFKVVYGPIRAVDIPAFLNSGNKASKQMRRVRFRLIDRLVLVPLEVIKGVKYVFLLMVVLFVLSGLSATGFSGQRMFSDGTAAAVAVLLAFVTGAGLTPALLPYVPGRAFALKGFVITIPVSLALFQAGAVFSALSLVERIALFLLMSAVSSFFAMNFTGASTYTSLSGVKKEMRIAVPLQAIGCAVALVLWIVTRFV